MNHNIDKKPILDNARDESKTAKTKFGCMRGSAILAGDLIQPINEKWNAENAETVD